MMKVVGFAGFSGSGKTSLVERLIPVFRLKGFIRSVNRPWSGAEGRELPARRGLVVAEVVHRVGTAAGAELLPEGFDP